MHYPAIANDRRHLTGYLCVLALVVTTCGCQSKPNGGVAWPWKNGGVASNSNPDNWKPPSNPFQPPGGWSKPTKTADTQPLFNPNGPFGSFTSTDSSQAPMDHYNSLMQRQSEQARLAEEQHRALAELTEYQRIQQQMMDDVASQKRNTELGKLQQQAELVRRQQEELEGLAEMRRRALELDANNRDLHAQLAQTQQQNRLLEDKSRLLQTQLKDTAGQLATSLDSQTSTSKRAQQIEADAANRISRVKSEAEMRLRQMQMQTAEQLRRQEAQSQQQFQYAQRDADQRYQAATQNAQKQVQAMEASMQRRGGATIRANSSLQRSLSAVSVTGLNVRQDGDVVRVEIPTNQIFAFGSATLSGNSTQILDRLAAAIRQNYSRQIIGIEAHTDNGPMRDAQWSSNHQLSAAQATAVFEELTSRYQFGARQLFVLGHGANYPIASNGTTAGQQKNRRVEIVIYPETIDSQQ